jgi:ribose transport system substrate-binding protein
LALLAGCGSSRSNAGDGCPLIGFTNRFIAGNAWEATLTQAIEAAGKNAGMCVDSQDAQGDVSTQVSQIKTFITNGAKAVIIEPVDDHGVASAIAQLVQAGIPFVVVNDQVAPDLQKHAFCNVHDDAFGTAKLVGAAAAAEAARRYSGSGGIKFWVNAIFPHEIVTETRENGFLAGWNGYWQAHPGPPITRIADQFGHALPDIDLPVVRNVLTANPDLNVMFNESDLTFVSVNTALHDLKLLTPAGDSNVLIGGFDGQTDIVKLMMDQPSFGMVATGLNQPHTQAAWAIEEVAAAMHGKPPVACTGTPAQRIVPPAIATPQNAKTYYDPNLHNVSDPSLVSAAYAETKKLMGAP